MTINKTGNIKRGEIYYASIPYSTGYEMQKARPCIVVSNDEINARDYVVEIVYLTSTPMCDCREHVTVRSSRKQSTALCDHVYSVDKARLGTHLGCCTQAEMSQIDIALAIGLNIGKPSLQAPQTQAPTASAAADCQKELDAIIKQREKDAEKSKSKIMQLETERNVYKQLYDELMKKFARRERRTKDA